MSKRWEQSGDEYRLIFTPFNDDETLATIKKDEDGDWVISSKTLNRYDDYEYLTDSEDDVEDVKKIVEESIEEHFTDEISYYEHLLKSFVK